MKYSEFKWPVVPICDAQLLDVNESDILNNGLYRKCDIYKGGGGYDKFGEIYFNRFGHKINSTQFVVQLKGCPLKCPYCYVTDAGVNGRSQYITSDQLVHDYDETALDVFHLMGGAPAMYLKFWHHIYNKVRVFHSDFLLIESKYNVELLNDIPGLHAISIKEPRIYSELQLRLLWKNLETMLNSKLNFYLTFTGEHALKQEIEHRFGSDVLRDSIFIPIINYKALTTETIG